jgi:DNA-binding MarR family transcriptional regulator
MRREYRDLHEILVDLFIMANQPKRDVQLLDEAAVTLDRALFPLLVGVEKRGPIGVGDLADAVGRDYTTVSRQIAKLEDLGLVKRQTSKTDTRVKEATLTAKGRAITSKISQARESRMNRALGKWEKDELANAVRIMRRLVDDLKSI